MESAAANRAFYDEADEARWGRSEAQVSIPPHLLGSNILEVGCGLGPTVPNAVVLDIAFLPLTKLEQPATQADAQALPISSASVDTYISVAAFEHFPNPSLALQEMGRVLRRGGFVFLAPAWNCRPWTAKGVTVYPYSRLPLRLKLTKLSLVVRERVWWRALWMLPKRLLREIRRPSQLDFTPLQPNLEEFLTSDSDAFASIDPHAAIVALRSWGYEIISHPTLLARLGARGEPVIARKPP